MDDTCITHNFVFPTDDDNLVVEVITVFLDCLDTGDRLIAVAKTTPVIKNRRIISRTTYQQK